MWLQPSRLFWRPSSFLLLPPRLHWCWAFILIICLACPTKCIELSRRLVTASPLPLAPHLHQWLHCMLQIPPEPTLQPISDRTLSPLTVPGIHPLRATCHYHSFSPSCHVFDTHYTTISLEVLVNKDRPRRSIQQETGLQQTNLNLNVLRGSWRSSRCARVGVSD